MVEGLGLPTYADADAIELYRDVDSYNSAFNHDASDKMKLLGLGELPPPAQCFVCGSGTCDAGYVNMGVWAEMVGNLLICAPCLVQASELIGCLAPVIKNTMEAHVRDLQNYARDLEQKLTEQDADLAAYRRIMPRIPDASLSGGMLITEPTSDSNDDGEYATSESEAESEFTESGAERGPDDLPDPLESKSTSLISL